MRQHNFKSYSLPGDNVLQMLQISAALIYHKIYITIMKKIFFMNIEMKGNKN